MVPPLAPFYWIETIGLLGGAQASALDIFWGAQGVHNCLSTPPLSPAIRRDLALDPRGCPPATRVGRPGPGSTDHHCLMHHIGYFALQAKKKAASEGGLLAQINKTITRSSLDPLPVRRRAKAKRPKQAATTPR